MRGDDGADVYLSAPCAVVGESFQSPVEAAAAGRLDADVARRCGYRRVATTVHAPVELAVRAADRTLGSAGVAGVDVTRLLHAWTYHQGHEFWSPAHYIAHRVGADRADPLGLQQMCNGGAAAVELATRELRADPEQAGALVTTADRFCDPGFDRWGDQGLAYGDGATAVLVGRAPQGRAVRLLASASAAAPAYEGLHGGTGPFTAAPQSALRPVTVRSTKKQYMERHPGADLLAVAGESMARLSATALDRAGVAPGDPRLVLVAPPRFAGPALESYRPVLEKATGAPLARFGADTGHLGAGDAIANLAELLASDWIGAGEMAVLVSAGGGLSWTVLVVERVM
ncbi:ketoacyl-ACP synthase III family protein [Streptomyces sp. NPDC057362]|uniref:ketoacyl-ACP synthase III family protein n=1 Tax=Streptomyces sp. NPDC057362 TaxID=3346106 RepID=UPI00363F594D